MPGAACPRMPFTAACATSSTKTGWNFVSEPEIGRTGPSRAIPAKRLKNWSSCPKMTEGRRITAPGKAARTAASPAALLCPYSDGLSFAAPMAERCTIVPTPASAAARAMRPGASAWMASKLFLPPRSKVPTQFTTASAPAMAARTEASLRMLHSTGSTWPGTP